VDDPDWVPINKTRLDWRPISMGILNMLLAGMNMYSLIGLDGPNPSPSSPTFPQYKAAGDPNEISVAPFGMMILVAVLSMSTVLNVGYELTLVRS